MNEKRDVIKQVFHDKIKKYNLEYKNADNKSNQ
jgi:hypothetical protein